MYVLQKKKSEEQKPAEEKIKKLKKRNAELAAIARRLEEKAKQLQQENSKVSHRAEIGGESETASAGEQQGESSRGDWRKK